MLKNFIIYLSLINSKRQCDQGLTLIELMIVVIFIGILAAFGYANIISQAAKAREVEMKILVGTINRAQQSYHFEKRIFAQGTDDLDSLEMLGITVNPDYVEDFNIIATPDSATLSLTNAEFAEDQTRAYSGGVFFNSGDYALYICQTIEVRAQGTAPTLIGGCGVNQARIQ
jgi:prepilin-type N-terminal cleavage/methylation domain-containing protein